MKRCIICGNLGDDNSTVCEVCGNPYMDLDDDAPDRMEAGDDPVTEPDISEDWEPEQEAPVAEEVEAQDEISEAEEIEEEPEQQAIAPKEEPEQQTMQTARPRTAGNNGHRMKSGPQIYGQMAGQGAPDQMQQDGMLRRTMNGNDRPANHHPTAGVRRPIAVRPSDEQSGTAESGPPDEQPGTADDAESSDECSHSMICHPWDFEIPRFRKCPRSHSSRRYSFWLRCCRPFIWRARSLRFS